ncbi:MIT protein [Trinorchestia longiramus]|nr:MIT protein [Trinorchestia longiramus]
MSGKEGGLPPVKIADYVVCEKIGCGGYADVYRAYKKPPAPKEFVAIKAVSRSNLSTGATDNLITEIRLLKRLKHEHIVQLEDFLCDENYVYIVMEYCGGGDLSHFIRSRHRLPEMACQRFLQQLASALKYMRDENVSHFDLKPQNILLASRKNPVVKIADFGLAQHMPDSESMSKIKGSPLYMAPEILLEKQYDAKVDLWSVGVILYECLFGKAPYSSATMEELVQRIQTDRQIKIPPNASISANCHDLLVRCLERDPAKRIDFDEFFKHPFVDLEHRPCAKSFEKARNLLVQATDMDQKQEYAEALELYLESLQYLVPAIYVESDPSRKLAMRQSAKKYLDRTEMLKKRLSDSGEFTSNNVSFPTLVSQDESERCIKMQHNRLFSHQLNAHQQNVEELLSLASTTATMSGAIDIAKSAELYEHEGSYSIALDKYELALGKLLSLLQDEPHGRRRELLLEVVKHWMEQAEQIKSILCNTSSGAEEVSDSQNITSDQAKKKNILQKSFSKLTDRSRSNSAVCSSSSTVSSPVSASDKSSILGKLKSKSASKSEPSASPTSAASSNDAPGKVLTEADYEVICSLQ